MPAYVLRRIDHEPNDYVFSCKGVEVGRCYLRTLSHGEQVWRWTIFIGPHVKRLVSGIPLAGYASTLEEAKKEFSRCFNVMIAAGVVKLN